MLYATYSSNHLKLFNLKIHSDINAQNLLAVNTCAKVSFLSSAPWSMSLCQCNVGATFQMIRTFPLAYFLDASSQMWSVNVDSRLLLYHFLMLDCIRIPKGQTNVWVPIRKRCTCLRQSLCYYCGYYFDCLFVLMITHDNRQSFAEWVSS